MMELLLRSLRMNVSRLILNPNSKSLPRFGTRFGQSKSLVTSPFFRTEGHRSSPLDPNDFKMEKTTMENFDLHFEFMDKYFYAREKLNTGFHVNESSIEEFRKKKLRERILSGVSTSAFYKPTNQLVAANLGYILTRENSCGFSMEEIAGLPQELQSVIKLLIQMEERANVFQDPKIEKVIEFPAGAVHPDFSGNRLMYKLCEESERLAKNLGCQIAIGQATSLTSQHMNRKMGYEELFRVNYETIEVDGKRVMDLSVLDGSQCVIFFKKELK